MNFVQLASTVFQALEREGLRYAVIDGFALGFWGIERSTTNIDFLLFIEDETKADQLLTSYGYHAIYKTDNVAQYESGDSDLGNLDIIFAFREISTQMLSRSVVFKLTPTVKLRVLVPEDIIGLKLQALCNDPQRFHQDYADIQALVLARVRENKEMDWMLLKSYFELFERLDLLQQLKVLADTPI